MKPKLFCTRSLPGESLEKLKEYYEVEVWPKYFPPPYEVIKEKARECDALISLLTDRIDKGILQGSKLKIVAQYAVGYNNIDVDSATSLGIYVTNTPGVLTDAVAELTWAMILGIARRIVEADYFVRSGEWHKTRAGWHPEMMLGAELKGKVLGIIGMGRIGKAVAEKAKAFGMKVIYYSKKRLSEEEEKKIGAKYVSMEEVFENADFISLHVPLTEETYHMVNWEILCKMKPNSFLINTSRGAVIDEKALIKALKEGKIAGAALDVFEEEPLPPNSELIKMKNVILLPHIGSATEETRRRMAEVVAENLIKFYLGEVPPNLVNPEVIKVRKPGFGGERMAKIKELVLSAFIFLIVFSSIHMISDYSKVALPFLASSEAIWEHMKMAIYAATITYLIMWRLRRKGSFSGLSSFTLASVFSIFTYYYSVVSITGPLGKISFIADILVAVIVTWLCGMTGAAISFKVEEVHDSWMKWFLITNYFCLVLLSFTTTYIGPPMPLFKPIGGRRNEAFKIPSLHNLLKLPYNNFDFCSFSP